DLGDCRLGPWIELIRVLARLAGRNIDRDDTRDAALDVAAILGERALHGADEHPPVWRDRETFHALVGDAADRVAADFQVALREELRDRELLGQRERADSPPAQTVELIHVRT